MTKARDKNPKKKGGGSGKNNHSNNNNPRNGNNGTSNANPFTTGKKTRISPHARFGFQQHSRRHTHTTTTSTRTASSIRSTTGSATYHAFHHEFSTTRNSTRQRRNKNGDQSSFGPLRFPEQGTKYKIRTGYTANTRNSSSITTTSTTATTTGTPSRKRARDRFQLRLPAVTPRALLYQDVAWFETFDTYSEVPPKQQNAASNAHHTHNNSNITSNNQKHDSKPCLATDFFPSDALEQLSRELHAFVGYVRLQPQEHEARQCMIRSITKLAETTFSGRGRYHDNDTHDVYLQVFGSYGTPEVCTYCSDVDMALWGVVEAPNSYPPTTTSSYSDETNQ